MSNNGDILNAITQRLQSITVANGYPITVKTVEGNKGRILQGISVNKLPYIDVINGGNTVLKYNIGNVINCKFDVTLRLVQPKVASDDDMGTFEACVLRCLFGNSYSSPQTNAKRLPYNGKELISYMEYIVTHTDYNMIEANRMWDINISCFYSRDLNAF